MTDKSTTVSSRFVRAWRGGAILGWAFFFFAAGCGGEGSSAPMPSDGLEPGWHERTFGHDGLDRVFRLYRPEALSEATPVVLLLHGGTRDMDALFENNAGGSQEWREVAEEEGAVLLVPNGTNPETNDPAGDEQFWNDCRPPGDATVTHSKADDVGFLVALLDWTAERLPIDRNRVLVTGSSNGGQMAYRLAIERPFRVAAFAVFIANLSVESECEAPSAPVPAFIANGTGDPITPFEGGAADGRGPFKSAVATRNFWMEVNRADTTDRSVEQLPDLNTEDESRVICEDDPASSSDAAPVRFCRVEGGGHTMPSIDHQLPRWVERIFGRQNHDVEGARLAWQFFRTASDNYD